MKITRRTRIAVLICANAAALLWLSKQHLDRLNRESTIPSEIVLIEHPSTAADKIVNGAKLEVIRGVSYDASYAQIPYPNGDVPRDRGACTDVVVRALRNAGSDLQKLIHEDMKAHFGLYPGRYGLTSPDPNIDHRRVPNHKVFLRRHGKRLPLPTRGESAESWLPGDIVYWDIGLGRDHCGVLSNDRNDNGLPLVIHNLGLTVQEDCLTRWKITGHFRYPPR